MSSIRAARAVVVKAMLAEQPLPLVGYALTRLGPQPISRAMTTFFASFEFPPPPYHPGTGVAIVVPRAAGLEAAALPSQHPAVGLAPDVR